MGNWETTTGDAGRSAPTVHVKKKLQVVVYPGETAPDDQGNTWGHLYVFGHKKGDFNCVIRAGPSPGHSSAEAGGHTRGETKAGNYTLGPKHHHITLNWPMSTIPWGADLSLGDDGKTVYYTIDGGKPVAVTGPKGVMVQANARYYDNTPADKRFNGSNPWPDRDTFINNTNALYYGWGETDTLKQLLPGWEDGKLKPKWYQNDFGQWAWNLAPTAYYIHTTPDDEWNVMLGNPVNLVNSHGCIHTDPKDRKKLEDYLTKGMPVVVKKYGEVGPEGAPPG